LNKSEYARWVDRRAQLLDVALELFDERGVRGASMRELARRAGVDVRSTYYHFESKRDLLRSLFERAGYLEPLDPMVLEALQSLTRPDALRAIIAGNLDMLQRRAAYSRLIHAQVLCGDEDAKAVGDELWARWGDQLEAMILAARVVDSDDARRYARFLRSLLWGIFNESQLTGELENPDRIRERAGDTAQLLLD